MRIRTDKSNDYITEKDHQIATIANALAHPLRVALVRYLSTKNDGKGIDNVTCNKDLVQMFTYSQSTISQHVKILKESGLFLTENKDKFVFYTLNKELLKEFTTLL